MLGRLGMVMHRLRWFWSRHILKIQIDGKLEGGLSIIDGKEEGSLARSSMPQAEDFIQLGMKEIPLGEGKRRVYSGVIHSVEFSSPMVKI